MRLSSVAELALSFKVTCRPNISCSSVVRLLTSGDLENSRGAEKGVSGLGSQSPYTNHEYMSTIEYISYRRYVSYVVYRTRARRIMIEIRIDELLGHRGRSFYWLAKETGISHTTLWRLKKGKALGINFETLEKICVVLKCEPGDVLSCTNRKKISKTPRPKSRPAK
jgi:putative transcriptional regulator